MAYAKQTMVEKVSLDISTTRLSATPPLAAEHEWSIRIEMDAAPLIGDVFQNLGAGESYLAFLVRLDCDRGGLEPLVYRQARP